MGPCEIDVVDVTTGAVGHHGHEGRGRAGRLGSTPWCGRRTPRNRLGRGHALPRRRRSGASQLARRAIGRPWAERTETTGTSRSIGPAGSQAEAGPRRGFILASSVVFPNGSAGNRPRFHLPTPVEDLLGILAPPQPSLAGSRLLTARWNRVGNPHGEGTSGRPDRGRSGRRSRPSGTSGHGSPRSEHDRERSWIVPG